MKCPNGRDRSGQVMQSFLIWKYIYNIQRAMQKLPTKFHVSPAMGTRVSTVDTQISSGHLIIFTICLHIKTGIFKSFKVPTILFDTLHGDLYPWSVPNIVDILGGESIYTCIWSWKVKGHDTFMAYMLMIGLLILF